MVPGVELTVTRDLSGHIPEGVTGRNKLDRAPGVPGVEVDRMSQEVTEFAGRREPFAELVLALGAHAKGCAGEEPEDPIARRVAE